MDVTGKFDLAFDQEVRLLMSLTLSSCEATFVKSTASMVYTIMIWIQLPKGANCPDWQKDFFDYNFVVGHLVDLQHGCQLWTGYNYQWHPRTAMGQGVPSASKQAKRRQKAIYWMCKLHLILSKLQSPHFKPRTLANLHQTFWELFKENEKEKGKKGKENRTLHEGSNLYLPIWVGSYKKQTL